MYVFFGMIHIKESGNGSVTETTVFISYSFASTHPSPVPLLFHSHLLSSFFLSQICSSSVNYIHTWIVHFVTVLHYVPPKFIHIFEEGE